MGLRAANILNKFLHRRGTTCSRSRPSVWAARTSDLTPTLSPGELTMLRVTRDFALVTCGHVSHMMSATWHSNKAFQAFRKWKRAHFECKRRMC